MKIREQAWWPEFCARLAKEPMDQLARLYGQSPAAMAVALNLADDGGSVLDTPWWPEAVRRFKSGASLREISRLFGVNLRRLRRGLARAGLRAAGTNLEDEGLPALEDFRDRLGQEPDAAVARAAGVSAEAVKGERRRLGIAPYRNAAGEAESDDLPPEADEVLAAAPPVAPAPVAAPPAAPPAAPTRSAAPPAAPPAAPASRPDARRLPQDARPVAGVIRRNRAPDAPRADAPRADAPRADSRRDLPMSARTSEMAQDQEWRSGRGVRTWFRSESPETTVVRRVAPGARGPSGDTARPVDEDSASAAPLTREEELARLSDTTPRERKGRLRLVRTEVGTPESTPEPVPEAPKVRRRRDPTYSPVRLVSPQDLRPSEIAELLPPVPTPEPEPVVAARPPAADALPPAADEPAVLAPVVELTPAAAEPPPVDPPETVEDEPSAPPVRLAPVRLARAPRPPRVAPPPAPVVASDDDDEIPTGPLLSPAPLRLPEPVASPAAPRIGWLVHLDGQEPLLILAPDVISATRRAAQEVGAERLASASITQLGPELMLG